MNTILYRLHTEFRSNLPDIASQYFPGFTILAGVGYFRNFKEPSATIEIYGTEGDRREVENLARAIATVNEQEEVLLAELGREGLSVTPIHARPMVSVPAEAARVLNFLAREAA